MMKIVIIPSSLLSEKLIFAAGFIQSTPWRGLSQCFDFKTLKEVNRVQFWGQREWSWSGPSHHPIEGLHFWIRWVDGSPLQESDKLKSAVEQLIRSPRCHTGLYEVAQSTVTAFQWVEHSSGTWLARQCAIYLDDYIYATANERRCSGFWVRISDQSYDLLDDRFGCSSWLKPWVPRGWHWVRSFVMRAAGGCLDKMTPSQTPGLPFKQRQMGPNSQTCPHQLYKK